MEEPTSWQYVGSDPIGRMSISFGTPLNLSFCPDECSDVVFSMESAYEPTGVALELLSSEISRITEAASWEAIDGAEEGYVAAIGQLHIVRDSAFGESRELVVLAAYPNRVAVFTWRQPIPNVRSGNG